MYMIDPKGLSLISVVMIAIVYPLAIIGPARVLYTKTSISLQKCKNVTTGLMILVLFVVLSIYPEPPSLSLHIEWTIMVIHAFLVFCIVVLKILISKDLIYSRKLSIFSLFVDYLHAALGENPMRNLILCPIAEELFFRSLLIGSFKQSILISSMAFSMAHLHPLFIPSNQMDDVRDFSELTCQLVITFIFGLYQGWLYKEKKGVLTCILTHAFSNLL